MLPKSVTLNDLDLVLFCCTVRYCLFSFFIFSLLATSSTKLNLNLNGVMNNFIHHKSGSNEYKDKQTNIRKWPLFCVISRIR